MTRLALALVLACSCVPTALGRQSSCEADSVFGRSWQAMGTRFRVQVAAGTRSAAEAVLDAARDEVERIEQLLSDYRPTSEWSRVERERHATLDPELFALLERVGELVRATGGAFDPSVGAAVDAWGFSSGAFHVPDDSSLARIVAATGWDRLTLDAGSRSISLPSRPFRIDPGAFGKGYAAERIADLLVRSGLTCALVDAGGSTYRALEAPPGRDGWPVQLPGGAQTVTLRFEALATSGSAARSFSVDGRTYGHVLDPRSGRPATADGVVHARAPSALDADALSTALYVVGPDSAAALLSRFPMASALFVEPGGTRVLGPWPRTP